MINKNVTGVSHLGVGPYKYYFIYKLNTMENMRRLLIEFLLELDSTSSQEEWDEVIQEYASLLSAMVAAKDKEESKYLHVLLRDKIRATLK